MSIGKLLDSTQNRFSALVDHGYVPPENPNGIKLGFFNANPFAEGIANLGYQVVADYLLQREVNVYFAFADTIYGSFFFLNSDLKPRNCDLIAISVPFEDTYLTVLRMLDSANLPIYARERGPDIPLVIIGGMAMINPIPLHEFGDVFILGEGREALYEIIQRFQQSKIKPLDKQAFLYEIADIPGVYIPSLYIIHTDDEGYVDDFSAPKTHETIEANSPLELNAYPVYSIWTSRYACYEYNDYFSMMIAMGCYMKCPYCVVGHTQGNKSGSAIDIDVDQIIELVANRRRHHGTNLIKLLFSSSFCHKDNNINAEKLKILLDALLALGFSARIGSLNIKQVDEELLILIKKHGQTNITIAPETAESLRSLINKSYITDDNIYYIAKLCARFDMDLTLYTLGGLPGETDKDTIELARLICSVRSALKSNCRLNVHYNQIFMKAQTPYQWFATLRVEEIRRKYNLLRSNIGDLSGIHFVTIIDEPTTYYQPILARGDFNVGRVLAYLYRKSFCDEFDWQAAFHELEIDDKRYFNQKDCKQRLPWEHIVYTSHDRLRSRFEHHTRQIERRLTMI